MSLARNNMVDMKPLPGIARAALFERLARGHAEGITVLTPNARLVQALQGELDARQLAGGVATWEAPDILPFGAYLERLYEELPFLARAAELPALLAPAAEQILWEEAIGKSRWGREILAVPSTAALAARAFALEQDWALSAAIAQAPSCEDAEAYRAWRAHYLARTANEGRTDRARLAALVGASIEAGAIPAPRVLVLYAFDMMKPAQSAFVQACAGAGSEVFACGPEPVEAMPQRARFESPRKELEHAARWARARLPVAGAPAARIAIVVPDLHKRRAEVARIFTRTLGAGRFNVSDAPPLSSAPLVDAALGAIELAIGRVDYARASRLLRSPFLEGAEAEMGARARLDAVLRREAPAALGVSRLRALAGGAIEAGRAPGCPRLLAALDGVIAEAQAAPRRGAAHDWARHFATLLDRAGFPGERALDSAEYQTLRKWHEALDQLAALGAVAPEWDCGEAHFRLHYLVASTSFQPASGTAPVQVLGVLESAGLTFDHLWVSGLTEEAWPLPSRPHPLIAPAVQRAAGIPEATPEGSFALDGALTQAWCRAAPQVVFSSARADGDRELLVSALVADIAEVPVEALAIPDYPTRRDALFAAAQAPGATTERIDKAAAPVASPEVRGGTRILVDQAACPFRAFAHYRLDARALEKPEPGLSRAERGLLLHSLMSHLWNGLGDQATLLAMSREAIGAAVEAAAQFALKELRADRPGRLEGRFERLEQERLAALAHEWLEIERARPAFTVERNEARIPLAAGPLRIHGRVDRVDRLHEGGRAVIDYKSSASLTGGAWLGTRPDDAQLPLYALAAPEQEEVRAVAFARLRAGRSQFIGFSSEAGMMPGVEAIARHRSGRYREGWPQLVAEWTGSVARLGEGFAAGDARIDPKQMLTTCSRCDLQPLCRVHERLGTLEEDDDPEPFP